jgi:hypothetical protein
MSTTYSLIYDKFLNKVSDYGLSALESTVAETVFLKLMKTAIAKFTQCGNDLSDRNDTEETFTDDLTELEQEILATRMVLEWINQKLYTSELMEQSLGTKDFQIFSPANLMKEIRETKNDIQSDVDNLIISYGYNKDLSELG